MQTQDMIVGFLNTRSIKTLDSPKTLPALHSNLFLENLFEETAGLFEKKGFPLRSGLKVQAFILIKK